MTVSLILIIVCLLVMVIVRLSTILVDLDIAALQGARSAVTVRELQTEGVLCNDPGSPFVSNNNRVRKGSPTVDPGNAFDLTCHGIDYGIRV